MFVYLLTVTNKTNLTTQVKIIYINSNSEIILVLNTNVPHFTLPRNDQHFQSSYYLLLICATELLITKFNELNINKYMLYTFVFHKIHSIFIIFLKSTLK